MNSYFLEKKTVQCLPLTMHEKNILMSLFYKKCLIEWLNAENLTIIVIIFFFKKKA